MYIEYDTRIERCKREDTKELVVTCLDKAAIDNNEQVCRESIAALETIGVLVVVVLVGIFIWDRWFWR